jgi:hypothetical protein
MIQTIQTLLFVLDVTASYVEIVLHGVAIQMMRQMAIGFVSIA